MLKRILFVILALICASCTIIAIAKSIEFANFLWFASSGERLARAMAPPQYPGSQKIDRISHVGSRDAYNVTEKYYTSDRVDRVLVFMEKFMPGFVMEKDPERGIIYRNFVEDKTDAAWKIADCSCSSLFCRTYGLDFPSVFVIIYTGPNRDDGTLIEVTLDYPTP